jgi:cyclopropane-fatty-acyl-phospholipid synthase
VNSKPSIVPGLVTETLAPQPSLLVRLGRALLLGQLARLEHGEIRIVEAGEELRFGRRSARCDLAVTVRVEHPQLYADAAFGGTVGAGEAYIRGLWRCDDLTALVRIFVVNRDLMNGLDSRWSLVSRPFLQLFHLWNRNSRTGSARNIAAHYDLGNALYEIMLDETMAYSCAIFERPDSSLHEAQIAKFDAVCRKLALTPADHLLEIGSGWGGLAVHAAQRYGCRVTSTTISDEQYRYARERVAGLGLGERVTLLREDYRDLHGRFDKLVSIEMVEAVGARYLDTYFGKCSALLHNHGAMLLQAITIQDQFYAQALKCVDYIQRFIFPGSFIPSVSALAHSLARVTDMKIVHLEDIGPHYTTTLRAWRERCFANRSKIHALGYPESFLRLWEYYLCYCEGGFAERQLGDVQLLLSKPGCRRPALPSSGH